MTYADRKQRAIENVQSRLDEARQQREWDEQERTQQAIDDRAEKAQQAEVHPMMRSESPGVRRAEASVHALLRERDEAYSEQDELAAAGLGDDERDDDGDADDEDDFI